MARQLRPAPVASEGAAEPHTIDTARDLGIDPQTRFVRVTEVRPDGFVAFDFAIGEPEIYVEMLLPQDGFEAFCAQQNVIRLDAADAADAGDQAPGDDFLWRLADAARAAAGEGATPTRSTD